MGWGGRNEGLRHAHGQYILFVDSDDWIAPTMVERLVDALESNDVDYVFCGLRGYDNHKRCMLSPERPFHSDLVEEIALRGVLDLREHPGSLTDLSVGGVANPAPTRRH
nr:glycosyltransferase [Acidithiobacillus sp. AMEEHan]